MSNSDEKGSPLPPPVLSPTIVALGMFHGVYKIIGGTVTTSVGQHHHRFLIPDLVVAVYILGIKIGKVVMSLADLREMYPTSVFSLKNREAIRSTFVKLPSIIAHIDDDALADRHLAKYLRHVSITHIIGEAAVIDVTDIVFQDL